MPADFHQNTCRGASKRRLNGYHRAPAHRKLAAPVKRQRRKNAGKSAGRLNDSCAALASLDTQLEHVREECDVPAAAQLYPTQAHIASEVKVQVVGMAPPNSLTNRGRKLKPPAAAWR